MSNWWGSRRHVSSRLIWEVEAMKATFGNTFALVVPPFGGLLYWQGIVEISMSILESPYHSLKIVYPKEYPNRPAGRSLLHQTANLQRKTSVRGWAALPL